MSLATRALSPATWPDFAHLVERHNGVWGGCWCMGYHARGPGWGKSADLNRAEKEALVQTGHAHAALVYQGETCVGWCQFGPTAELPRIKYRKAYDAGQTRPPDWRITCFFVDRTARGKGVAAAALAFALDEIARAGGGRVEAHAEDVAGRKVSGSFLYGGTAQMFEAQGFTRDHQLGKHVWLMARDVAAAQ